jgi:hypothetical protein
MVFLSHGVTHPLSADQMQMDMVDRLSAIGTRVDDQAVAAMGNPCLAGKLTRDAEEMPDQLFIFRVECVYRFDMLVRHNQIVSWRDRVPILEGGGLLVAINDPGPGFTGDDLAEMA